MRSAALGIIAGLSAYTGQRIAAEHLGLNNTGTLAGALFSGIAARSLLYHVGVSSVVRIKDRRLPIVGVTGVITTVGMAHAWNHIARTNVQHTKISV